MITKRSDWQVITCYYYIKAVAQFSTHIKIYGLLKIINNFDFSEEKTANAETDPTKEQMPSLTRRVMDIMLMKKTNMEKNVEHFKSNGIKLTGGK